jgi:hypothetical protein
VRTFAEELRASAAARSELGDDYDGAVVRSLVERLDAEIEGRDRQRRTALWRDAVTVVIALGSIGLGVLVGAAADGLGEAGATVATIVAWVAIAVINVVHARR